MSERAIDTCRRAYELYGSGDIEAMLELFAPDVEVYVAPPNFESGTYRGRDEYAALLTRWGAEWESMRIKPRELTLGAGFDDDASWVLAMVDYHGRGQGSALEVDQPSWEVSLWRGGLCVRYEVYWEEAAGEAAFAERRGD